MIEYNKQVEQFKSLTSDMIATYSRKNKDYGNSFSRMCREYGNTYPIIHLDEKLARIKAILLAGDNAVKDETAIDSLLDLACYSLMTIMELQEQQEPRTYKITGAMAKIGEIEQ